MSRNYERLSIEEFGRQLITTGDLDPVYIALKGVKWDSDQVSRWLIAYWCFYHCGLSSYASERTGKHFWTVLRKAAANSIEAPIGGRWPRGHERRHARGQQGINMVEHLVERYGNSPEAMLEYLETNPYPDMDEPEPFVDVAKRVKEHNLFGPWIAFKIGDMLERVRGVPICFEGADIFMFKDPVKATDMLYRQRHNIPEHVKLKMDPVIKAVVNHLVKEFADLKAPPLFDRAIGLQEVETVLCKWKSHMNGHYPLFNDINEIHSGLKGWGEAADQFAAAMPPEQTNGTA